MTPTQDNTKEWIRAVAAHMNMSPSQLATSSGVAASTITRYVNDKSGTVGISQRTLDAISGYTGIQPHRFPGERKSGLIEPDAVPFNVGNADNDNEIHSAIRALIGRSNTRAAWIMKGWALELAGILPGDILIIDEKERPRAGDIVCALVADWRNGTTENVMRVYEPPYILTHSARLGVARPEQVDDDRVSIRGIRIASFRPRRAS